MLQNVLYFLNFIDTNDCITRTQPNCCMEAHRSPSKLCMPVPAPIMTLGLCLIGGCIGHQGRQYAATAITELRTTLDLCNCVVNQHSNTSTRSNYNHHSLAVGCGAGSRSCSITQLAWSCSGWGPSTDVKSSGLSLSCFRVLCVAFAVRADR